MAKDTSNVNLDFISLDEIKAKIEKSKKESRNSRWFFFCQMTKENYDRLTQEGYKIHTTFPIETDNFKISW